MAMTRLRPCHGNFLITLDLQEPKTMKKRTIFYHKFIRANIFIFPFLTVFSQIILANPTVGQVLEKRLSISFENTNLSKALRQLQQAGNIDLAYDDKLLQLDSRNVKAKKFDGETVAKILNHLLNGTKITYELSGKTILIVRKQQPQQQGHLTGKIIDTAGKALPGANIRIVELSQTYSTNAEGVYSINLNPGNYTVEVTFVSFKSERKTITVEEGKTTVADFILKTSERLLNQVVVLVMALNPDVPSQLLSEATMAKKWRGHRSIQLAIT